MKRTSCAFRRIRWLRVFCGGIAAGGIALSAASCTSVSAQGSDTAPRSNNLLPTPDTAVFITRVGDELTISWMAKTGAVYTLISKDRSRPDAAWTPVPGYENMPGTGKQESIVLRVPSDDARVFNITSAPQTPPASRRRR